MIVWSHSVTALSDFVSPWLASMLPLHLAYTLDALECGVIISEKDPRIKPYSSADVDIWGCPSADLPDCLSEPSKNLLGCSTIDGAESHGQGDSVEPLWNAQPCSSSWQDLDSHSGKIFVQSSEAFVSQGHFAPVHSVKGSGLESPDSSLRSCLRGQASRCRTRHRVHFSFEIQFWFPGSSQLHLPRLDFASRGAPDNCSGRHVGLRPPEPLQESKIHAHFTSSGRHVGLRPPSLLRASDLPLTEPFIIFADDDFSRSGLAAVPSKGGSCRTLADSNVESPSDATSSSFAAPLSCKVEPVYIPCPFRDITNLPVFADPLPPVNSGAVPFLPLVEHVGVRSPHVVKGPEGGFPGPSPVFPAALSSSSIGNSSGTCTPKPILCPRKTSSAKPKAESRRGPQASASCPVSSQPFVLDDTETGRSHAGWVC